jgi:DNA-binding NarL/FixJ family response regulator
MQERARAVGGTLNIESEPGEGTKVRLETNLAGEGEEPQPQEETHVLLVEDHASFREAAASVFEHEPGFEVVGQAGSLAEAREILDDGAAAKVDVAIVDLGLPDGYGGELIKELREAHPQAQALVLSATLERSEVARAVEAGAAGVLHKSEGIEKVMEDVRRLRTGETLLPLQEVVELVRFASSRRDREREERAALERLTPREIEVLKALAEGLDSKDIARRLHISPTTERNHMASILAKLKVHSRLQALVFALRHGIARTP